MAIHTSGKRSTERKGPSTPRKAVREQSANPSPAARGAEDLELAALVVRCRTEKGLSLEQVGEAVGLSGKTVSNIELGRSAARRTTRAALEKFLRECGYGADAKAGVKTDAAAQASGQD